MQGRSLPDWINGFLQYTKNSESPRSYLVWSACSAIAAALQRKCVMEWDTDIYPNLYVVLVGPSGKVRKTDGIRIARSLVESINIPLLGEENTIESVIQTMAQTQIYSRGSRIISHSSMSCFVEELSIFINQKADNAKYFTTWYDCRPTWKRNTKHQGRDEVIGVFVNILAATAPDWLPSILSLEAVGGGFTSRCIFVVEQFKHQTIADPTMNRPDKQLFKQLSKDLESINVMAGEFQFDAAGRSRYVQWYEIEDKKLIEGKPTLTDPNLQGYNSRRATHVKKLAMIMSASRGNDFTVTAKDFGRALALLETAEKNMYRVFTEFGENKYSRMTSKLMDFIQERKTTTRSEILRHFQRSLDDYSFSSIIKMLSDMKVVSVTLDRGEARYKWIGHRPHLTIIEGDKED